MPCDLIGKQTVLYIIKPAYLPHSNHSYTTLVRTQVNHMTYT